MSRAVGLDRATAGRRNLDGLLLDLASLMKPGVVSLLVWTGAASTVAAARGWPGASIFLAVVAGGGMAAGGAGAINCAIDRDIDTVMHRTRGRPVPAGRLSPATAVGFGIALNGLAFAVLASAANLWAALLAMGGTLWYVGVYSLWLKRRTPSNIVIGGLAGSFPPLVGWAAATGRVDATALVLALVIFLWTPPHFWSLSVLIESDYRRADVPMLPVLVGPAESARRVLLYAVATLVASLIPVAWGGFGVPYLLSATIAGGWFVLTCARSWRRPTRASARRVFTASLVYPFVLFATAAADRLIAALP